MSDPFQTFGTDVLCTWRNGSGSCRFQTREPLFAKKLSKRRGARLVAWSVCGGYLRIFQERIAPWRARLLVSRYLESANEGFPGTAIPPTASKVADRVISAGERDSSTIRIYGKKS